MKFFLTLLFFATVSTKVSAYIDPGTGSMVLQGIIAGIAIGWLAIKTYWYRITGFFGKKRPDSLLDDSPDLDKDIPGD